MNGAEIHHLRSHTAPFDSMHSPTRSPSPTDSSCWLHVVAICYLYCSRLDELRERFKEELVLRGPTAAPFDKHGEELYRRCALPLQSALVDAQTRCRRSCLCGPSLLTERACMLPPPPLQGHGGHRGPGRAGREEGGGRGAERASKPAVTSAQLARSLRGGTSCMSEIIAFAWAHPAVARARCARSRIFRRHPPGTRAMVWGAGPKPHRPHRAAGRADSDHLLGTCRSYVQYVI